MATQTRSETPAAVAAAGDQFRKTAETAAEQTRKTLSAAQEQIRHNVTEAQQAQSEWARMMLRLNEQNAHLATAAFNSFWDASLTMLKMAAWGEEVAERTVRQMVEQTRAAREEGVEILKDAAEQARHDQAQLFRLGQENLRVGIFYAGRGARREPEPARPPAA